LGLLALLLLAPAAGQANGQQEAEPERSATAEADEPSPPVPDAAVEEEIVVSATRLEEPARTAGSSVTVIDRRQIERRKATTVADVLRIVPGLEVIQTGGAGKVTNVALRGGNASHTLVLVDGLRVNSTTTGELSFSELMAENVERIEVLRGPQAIYGSEAVSGVVSIVTARGRGPLAARLFGEVGSDELRHARGSVNGARSGVDYSLVLSDLHGGAISHLSERAGAVEHDPYENRSLSARLGVDLGVDRRFDLSLRGSDGDTALDGFPGEDLNATQRTDSLTAAASADLMLHRRWQQVFRAGVAETDLLGEDPDSPFNNYTIDSQLLQLQSLSHVELGAGDTLSVGYDYERRKGRIVGSFDESVDLESLFVQNVWALDDRLHLTAAARRDEHSTFGGETTYRVTAMTRLPGGAGRLHGSAGTAFRAPSFNELYFPFSGDPTLAPETSEGVDVGWRQKLRQGELHVDVTWFSIEVENLISFDLDTFVFRNIGEARSQGVEAMVSYRPSQRWGLLLTHTYDETEDLATGLALTRRPRNRTTLLLDVDPLAWLRLTGALYRVGDRFSSDGTPLDDYDRVDLTAELRSSERFRPFVRIENALDEEYEEVPGFTTPDLSVAVGLSVDLR
jgi:vitamin B12 transporter